MRTLIVSMAAIIIIGMVSFTKGIELTVTSMAFKNNSMIPAKYSCEGEETNPPLRISNIPAGAKSLAVIVHDPDAPVSGGFTHWVLWNLPTDGNIPENFKGAEQGMNGARQHGYKGMCPPSGTHHYHFKVYALDIQLKIGNTTDKAGLENAMSGHILATGDLVGLYKKNK